MGQISEPTCSVPTCGDRHYAKGYCKKHYTQVLRHGRLTPEVERGVVRTCVAPGCDRNDTIKHYCRRHARQMRVHGRLTPELEHMMGRVTCTVKGCKQPYRAKGMCAMHYGRARWRRVNLDRKGKFRTLGGRAARKAARRPGRKGR